MQGKRNQDESRTARDEPFADLETAYRSIVTGDESAEVQEQDVHAVLAQSRITVPDGVLQDFVSARRHRRLAAARDETHGVVGPRGVNRRRDRGLVDIATTEAKSHGR